MRNLRILALVVATGMIVAACSSASTAPSGAQPSAQSSVGPGEGEVDLVIWAGYADASTTDPNDNWVTDFTTKTGCVVKTQDGTDSANMVQLMQSGQYDGVSASGDATLRLIYSGEVAPVNPLAGAATILGVILQTAVFHIYGRLPGALSPRAASLARAAIAAVEALGQGAP